MNYSIYFFGKLGHEYIQYPNDYTKEIFKEFSQNIKSKTQIIIHRQDNLMYYGYIRKLDLNDSQYVGICIVLNHAMFENINTLFQAFEKTFVYFVFAGEILKIDNDGNIIYQDTNEYISLDEIEKVRNLLQMKIFNERLIDLPPTNYSINNQETKEFLIDESNKNIINQCILDVSSQYGYTIISKEKNFDTMPFSNYKNRIKQLSIENEKLKQNLNEFTSEKRGVKRKRNVSTLAFILCTCIIVLLIEFFVLRENHQDKKNIVATEESIIRNNETVIAELRRKLSDSNERKSKLEFDLKDQDMKNKLLMKLLDSILVENNELKQQVGKTHFSISTYPNKENVNTENSYVDVINPPVFAKSSANIGMKIKRVQITSTQTIIDFEYSNYENSIDRISISSKAYLTIDYSTKYYLIRSEGLPVFLSSQYDKVEFRLIFPALPKNTTKFDFREINGLWNFFEIRLK